MREAVETKVGKIGVAKTKGKRNKEGSWEETGRKRKTEKTKTKETEKRKINRGEKSSGGMGNLRQGRGDSKIRGRGEEAGSGEIS